MNQLQINTDGGSRGNPGPAAIGIVFGDSKNKEIYTFCEYIGVATNNEAEYRAVIKALEILLKSRWFAFNNSQKNQIIFRLDSKLVVEQINENYKIKQPHILELSKRVKGMTQFIKANTVFIHVPREENCRADELVNKALDENKKQNQKKA